MPLFFCIGGLKVDHFQGVTAKERYDNELLNELRQIRQLLERNAQAVEQTGEPKQRQPRQKRSEEQ